jgi:hypothetical protein
LRLVFYGQYLEGVAELARRFDVEAFVKLRSTVPYRQALELQKGADLLLLLQWNAASELGNVPGKLFEYLATGRPILGLGPEAGVPARMVRKRGAGLFSNDPTVIAGYLRDRVEEKRRSGVVAPLPETAREGLTRDEQYAHLERFLQDLLTSRRPAAMNIGEDMELSRRIQAELVPPGSARRERDVAPSDLAAEYESSSFGSPR